METTHILQAFHRINKQWFDSMLHEPTFEQTTRGKFGIRYSGSNTYRVNLEYDITENDLILEMVSHLYKTPHDGLMGMTLFYRAKDYGYNENETQVIHKAMHNTHKQTTRLKKFTCGCTTVRCATDFRAICVKCGGPFKEVEA